MSWYHDSRRHSLARRGIKSSLSKNTTNSEFLFGDFDNDKVPNYKDCRPLDKNRQDDFFFEGSETYVCQPYKYLKDQWGVPESESRYQTLFFKQCEKGSLKGTLGVSKSQLDTIGERYNS